MEELIIETDSQKILCNDPLRAEFISLIGVLEGFLNKVSKKHFNIINSDKLEDVTLAELGLIYNNFLYKNTGMQGVCWEYAIYYAIAYQNTYVQDLINNAINYLSKKNTSEKINAILWGGEKSSISLENIKKNLKDNETIWTPNKEYSFKNYIDIIKDSFNKKNIRNTLPNDMSGIWKADLFVKKDSSNTWYAVTVKWNKSNMECYPGLSIGIYFEYVNPNNTQQNPYDIKQNPFPLINMFGKNYFVNCSIPFYFNFGEYYAYTFRLVKNALANINCEKPNSLISEFPTGRERYIFNYLYDNRYAPCGQIIQYLKSFYCCNNSIIESNEVILATDRNILINPFENNNPFISIYSEEKETGIKLIPNKEHIMFS